MNISKVSFLDLTFLSISLEEAVKTLSAPSDDRGRAFHLVNAFTLTEANRLPGLHSILKEDFLVCDGAPLALVLSKKNNPVRRIRGADLMRCVLHASPEHLSHFFLGSAPSVLEALLANVKRDNPELKIAGSFSPPYQEDFSSLIPTWVNMLKESKAQVVWVGLGTPKQDYVVHEISKQMPITAIAVGAAFDYLAGTLAETPKIIQTIGFEWLYRLVREPKRLWKRYLIGNIKFLWISFKGS